MLVLLLNVNACNQRDLTEEEIRVRNRQNWDRLPEDIKDEHREATRFAFVFKFDYQEREFYGIASVGVAIMHSGHRNVTFVISEEEARTGDENTFYLWPSHITPRILTVLNHILIDEDVDWGSLPISYPITIEDLAEHWRVIWDLCQSLDIWSPANNRLSYPRSYEALSEEENN